MQQLKTILVLSELIQNIDFYFDGNGYMIFTEKYLKDRGTCCGNGCRHCPYDYQNVPEPQRTQLLLQRYPDSNL